MCKDYDLFGDVIVTLDDVELWLDTVPRYLSNAPNARLRYAKNYDIASKIKVAKMNNTFYQLEADKQNLSPPPYSARFLFHPDYEAALIERPKLHRLCHLIGEV
jgi:hypothetical protein